MKRIRRLLPEFALGIALAAAIAVGAAQSSDNWQDKLIRLHVVADSDSAADQAQKLEVRDAVLAVVEPLMDGVGSAKEAKETLTRYLPEIKAAADELLADSGKTAAVTLQREVFPLREYETFTLPAGEYEALRITIGSGEGHNWWCVVYPSLCFTASAEEFQEKAIAAGLTKTEAAMLTGQSRGYIFRLKIVEICQRVKKYFELR